ncbi:MAG: CAP domain-containing protein [Thermoflexales bacterium]|nr:CAP domain-containing protein [Thermoflexales bacterium]
MKSGRIHPLWMMSVGVGAVLLLLLVLPGPATGASVQGEPLSLTPQVYLPLIWKSPTCALSPQEAEVARYMIEHSEQQRPSLTCHPILARVARERAEDMARRGYFSHVTPEGYGPNYLVRQAGYVLPSYYDQAPDANNIESIAAGYPSASAVWNGWMNSSGHRTHLLGLHPFFAEQVEYGVGYAYLPGSPYGYYWVVITAKPGP